MAKRKPFDLLAVTEQFNKLLNDEVHVALCVHPSWNCQADEIFCWPLIAAVFLEASKHDVTDLAGPYTTFDVQRGTE